MSAARHDQDGFTLVELLATMAISGVILFGMVTVFATTAKQTVRVSQRVAAAQAGRLAVDRVTTLLDSMTCLPGGLPSFTYGVGENNATETTFTAQVTGTAFVPSRYEIALQADATLTERRWTGVETAPGVWSFPTLTGSRVLARNVSQTVVGGVTQPVFSYVGYAADGTPTATVAGPTTDPLARATIGVRVRFTVRDDGAQGDTASADILGDGFISTAHPADTTVTPNVVGGAGCEV